MPKTYRFRIDRVYGGGETPLVHDPLIEVTDTGYFISRLLASWAKRVNEPMPVVKMEGQEEMDL